VGATAGLYWNNPPRSRDQTSCRRTGKLIAPVESFAPPPARSTLDQASIQPAPNPSEIDAKIADPHITTQSDSEGFVESPRVDANRQGAEELIDSREDNQCGQAHQSTRGQNSESTCGKTDLSTRGQSLESTREEGNQAPQSTGGQSVGSTYEEDGSSIQSTRGQSSESTRGGRGGKQSTFAIKPPPIPTELRKPGSKPLIPEGFEIRQRDNRWHLYRLHGKKLSTNGKPMWNRSYIGSFTEEGLRSFYEREQNRIKDESIGQRAAVVNLLDRKRGEGAPGAGKRPPREAGG
jgi:hypothetical protein